MEELNKEQLLRLYMNLKRSRKYDELCIKLLKQGKLMGYYHSCQGHEAVAVGACTFLRRNDYLYPHHRGHGIPYALSKGMDPKSIIAEFLGRATGCCKGMNGLHLASPEYGILAVSGTIGSCFPLTVGYAIAAKKRGQGQIAICFTGDGGMQRGQAHESMNLASCWQLPVVWVVENNLMALAMPFKESWASEHIADITKAYNMPGTVVDGMDVLAVHEAVQVAVERARAGEGPSLVECKTYRYRAHSEGRDDLCHYQPRSEGEIEAWRKKDPVDRFLEKIVSEGILTRAMADEMNHEFDHEVEAAEKLALESPYPDSASLDKVLYSE